MKDFYKTFLGQDTILLEAVAYARRQLREHSARTTKFNTQVDLEDHLVPQIHCHTSEIRDNYGIEPDLTPEKLSNESRDLSNTPIGREGDILRLEWLLSNFENTRIHLQGSPGVGKTSLLSEAAAWWHKTGFFQQVAYVQLSDLQFQSCTTGKILSFIAKCLKLFNDDWSSAALTMALNNCSYLLVIDSVDSIAWSSTMLKSDHERLLSLSLRKLKSCSMIISSRTSEPWLKTVINFQVVLNPVSLSNSISIGTRMLQKLSVTPENLATLDNRSFFEQLIGLSECNPLVINLLMHDLANEFAKDPTMSLLAHLMGLFRLRPIFLDFESFLLEEGARAIRELLGWIYEECRVNTESRQTSKHASLSTSPEPGLINFSHQIEGFETLQRSLHRLRLGADGQLPSETPSPHANGSFQYIGLHPAMVFAGFWHVMPKNLDPFTSAVATLDKARQDLDPIEFQKFRGRLCESTDESAESPNYIYDMLLGGRPFGLTPEVAKDCASVSRQMSLKVRQSFSKKLRCYVNVDVVEKFGEEGHSFTRLYTSIHPLLTIVSQSSIVTSIWPRSFTHDVEIARDFAYRHGIGEWASCLATAGNSPFNNAVKMELDYDYYNFLCLTLSYQQLDSWPSSENWQFQYVISQAGMMDTKRIRLLERVHFQFISMGVQRLRQIREKYLDPLFGGYDLESQDKGKKDWHVGVELETACFNLILRAGFFRIFLRKSQDDYLSQLEYITTRPMFLVWRLMDPDLRKLIHHGFASHKRMLGIIESGQGLNLRTAQDTLRDLENLRSLQREIFGSRISTKNPDETLPLPAKLSDLELTSLGGQELLLFKANRVINQLSTESDLNDTQKLTKAIEDTKALLLMPRDS